MNHSWPFTLLKMCRGFDFIGVLSYLCVSTTQTFLAMTTITTLILFAAAIILMVVAIARWKVHPFLAILSTALLLAILLGVPFADIPDVIGKGFGSVMSGIALVIIFGSLIGSVLEQTGGAVGRQPQTNFLSLTILRKLKRIESKVLIRLLRHPRSLWIQMHLPMTLRSLSIRVM